MKICKDCKHYVPAVSMDGGSLLPGFLWHHPAQCEAESSPVTIDLVDGTKRGGSQKPCSTMRAPDANCGPTGEMFAPKNLDGRLAMLEKTDE